MFRMLKISSSSVSHWSGTSIGVSGISVEFASCYYVVFVEWVLNVVKWFVDDIEDWKSLDIDC